MASSPEQSPDPVSAEPRETTETAHETTESPRELRLAEIPLHETVEVIRLDLPADQREPLLERGVLPGCLLCPVRRSPSGDPIIQVDGSMLALRRELAGCICVRRTGKPAPRPA